MTTPKLDVSTLTAEERAILQACLFNHWSALGPAIIAYGRALFGEPEPAPKPATLCPNCKEAIDYSTQHFNSGDMHHVPAHYTCQPKPQDEPKFVRTATTDPSEPPSSGHSTMGNHSPAAVVERNTLAYLRSLGMELSPAFFAKAMRQIRKLRDAEYFDAAVLIEQLIAKVRGHSAAKVDPTPPSTMPEAVRIAVEKLHDLALGEYGYNDLETRQIANDLADFWRTHAAQPAPAKEQAKVCPNCGKEVPRLTYHRNKKVNHNPPEYWPMLPGYTCQRKPQAEPPREEADEREMPEAVLAIAAARKYADELDHPSSMEWHIRVDGFVAGAKFHAAQPAPAAVRMTEELEELLGFNDDVGMLKGRREEWNEVCAAVRAQAAQPQKVELTKVRAALDTMRTLVEPNCQGGGGKKWPYTICMEALAELAVAEGKVKP